MVEVPCPACGAFKAHRRLCPNYREATVENQVPGPRTVSELDEQDRATIRAALRYYQYMGMGDPANRPLWLHNLATDRLRTVSLDEAGITDLCAHLDSAENVLLKLQSW